jgi:hypothetical protein
MIDACHANSIALESINELSLSLKHVPFPNDNEYFIEVMTT